MKDVVKEKLRKAKRRAIRVRAKISGTSARPRLTIKRSAKHLYAQLIDDAAGKTLASASDIKMTAGKPLERAAEVGKALAEAGKKAGVSFMVVDRGSYKFHGRVKALVDAAVEGGISITK
jgi:large subunit ribosomal protein L18